MKKLFFLMILFAFGCSRADLQPSENIDSQIDEIDVTLYLLSVSAGSNGWVSLHLTEPSDYLAYQNLQDRALISILFPAGTEVTVSATPADGYYFDKWSNGWTGNPTTFTLNSDINIYPVLKPD